MEKVEENFGERIAFTGMESHASFKVDAPISSCSCSLPKTIEFIFLLFSIILVIKETFYLKLKENCLRM